MQKKKKKNSKIDPKYADHRLVLVFCPHFQLKCFEIVNIGEEEADEAEGHDPLTDGTSNVEAIVLVICVPVEGGLFDKKCTDHSGNKCSCSDERNEHTDSTPADWRPVRSRLERYDTLQDYVNNSRGKK